MRKYPRGYQMDFITILRGVNKLFNPIQEGMLKSPNPSKMPKMTPNELKIGMKADIFNYYEKIPKRVIKKNLSLF